MTTLRIGRGAGDALLPVVGVYEWLNSVAVMEPASIPKWRPAAGEVARSTLPPSRRTAVPARHEAWRALQQIRT